jgi:POT family proton-dependent oligopeptide transporter
MLLGLVMFVWGRRYLLGHAEPPNPRALERRGFLGLRRETAIYLGAIAGLVPLAGLMWAVANHKASLGDNVSLAMAAMLVVMLAVLAWFAWFVLAKCDRVERHRMLSLMALIFMCLVFFTLYEQTYGSWITFNDRLMTKDIVPALVRPEAELHWGADWVGNVALFFANAPWSTFSLLLAPLSFMFAATLDERRPGSPLPRLVFGGVLALLMLMLVRDLVVLPQNASSLTYLGSLFLVLLAPLFTVLWGWLDRRGADPSKPVKSAIGLALGGLAFVPLALAAQQAGAQGVMVSVWWLVLAYFVLELGEMCLSPVGLSAVTQLSVPKVVSLMMGTWFLATAFSEALAAQFGKLAAIEIEDGGALAPGSVEWVAAAAKYEHLFWLLTWIGLGCALVAFLFAPLIRRGMHGVR